MNNRFFRWGPRLLILILVATAAFAGAHAGILHLPGAGTAFLGGTAVVQAIMPIGMPDMFSVATLTDAINKLPQIPTKIGDSNLFREEGINTQYAAIDEYQGRVSLIQSQPRNADPVPVKRDGRKTHTLRAVHLPASAVIEPDELDSIRPFGAVTIEMGVAKLLNNRQMSMKNRLIVTREWHRMGALRGQVLDADGTVLLDLFQEWGVTKATQVMNLNVATTDVRANIMAARRPAELKLGGVMVQGWRAYCSPSFMDAFVGHASVQKAFANWSGAQEALGGDVRRGFTWGGVEWIEYNAIVGTTKFVPDGLAILFPVADIYRLYNAPANYMETVGSMGLPFYAKAMLRDFDKGYNLEAQSNPLALAEYPETLIELAIS